MRELPFSDREEIRDSQYEGTVDIFRRSVQPCPVPYNEIQPYQHIKIPKGRGVEAEIKDKRCKSSSLSFCHVKVDMSMVGVVSGGNIVQVYEVQHR